MQSPNRNKYTVAGVLAKFIMTHPEFDSQQFEAYATTQPKILKGVIEKETRLALLGFKAAGVITKAGYRQSTKHSLPIVVWQVSK
jgi:hypothetical protein